MKAWVPLNSAILPFVTSCTVPLPSCCKTTHTKFQRQEIFTNAKLVLTMPLELWSLLMLVSWLWVIRMDRQHLHPQLESP
jgi:hypothetical protein